jgi:hypothetical protein
MKIFEQIEGFVSSKLYIIKMGFELVKLEARLAGLSVYPLLLNICMLLIVLMATWFVTMLLFGYGILFKFQSIVLAIGSVLLLNIMLLGFLLKYLSFNLRKMSFEKTREYFSNKVDNDYDKLEEGNHCNTCRDGKKINVPTT